MIVLAGLAGPLLGASGRILVPVIVGELLGGLVLGRSGIGWLRPDEPTTAFLAEIGFAMLMFTAGMHVPIGNPALVRRLRQGAFAALVVAGAAAGAGWLTAQLTHVGHPAIYAVVLGSGSAAVLVPALEEFDLLDDPAALVVAAQVAIADVAGIVAVPFVMRPGRAWNAALGTVLIAICAVATLFVVRQSRTRSWVRTLRRRSKQRAWALDLRLSLLVLFSLCWIAVRTGTSILIAGFAIGLVVAAVGGPKRFSRQVTGIGQGFFVPLFFVVLGARIDVRAFVEHSTLIELALLLIVFDVAIHAVGAAASRQPAASGLAATAELGVPTAVVSIGLQGRLISAGTAAAIMVAALVSIAISTVGVARLARREAPPPTAAKADTAPAS